MNLSNGKGSTSSSPLKAGDAVSDQFPVGLRVLVVDDDPTCLMILERMLRACLYEVTKCKRAEVALSLLRANKNGFDIVLSDVHMPDMDGFKLLEHIGLEMDLPVIMMSADDGKNVVMKGVTHGACDYLIKPVRIEALKNIWQHVIRKRKNGLRDVEQSGSVEEDRPPKGSDDGDYSSSVNEGKSSRKRRDEEDEGDERDDTSTLKKPRVVWSVELHQQFMAAVNQLGIDKAVPKKILELMNVPGLTRENVARHSIASYLGHAHTHTPRDQFSLSESQKSILTLSHTNPLTLPSSMADSTSSPATLAPNPQPSESAPPNQPDPLPQSSTPPSSTPLPTNPNPNPTLLPPPPTLLFPAGTPPQVPGVLPPSFRPLAPQVPQFSPVPAPNPPYQNPTVPPPGVASAAAAVPPPQMQPMMPYQVPPGQPGNPNLRPFAPIPNGYAAAPTVTPAGIPRYPPPYGTMVRPVFPPRPPGAVNIPPVSRPPVAGIPAVRPIIPPVVRPLVAPSVTPAEKPQNTVYIGKIAPTVENEFMLSLLQLCGTIKTWKRPQDLSTGTPTSFGFYEFDSAEGVLRALRLLTKLNIDGQELRVNVNQTMKKHLEQYVQQKTENLKNKETQEGAGEKGEGEQPSNANEDAKADTASSNKETNESANKESHDVANFGVVTDEDKEADREALEKITKMIEERLKTRPLPTPPAQPTGDCSVSLTSEQPVETRDRDSVVDTEKNESAENKNEKETNNDNKPTSEHQRPESPDRRHDRKSRERDRDRELKREKERELERYEREAERERVRKEREQRRRVEEAERQYETYLKDWEYREREKEKERQYEKEKEKERERKRRKEILYDEEDEDEDSRKRWRRSVIEEKRKKRLREKEDDLVDRQKEEEEIAEAKKKAEEEQKRQRDALKLLTEHVVNGGNENMITEEITNEVKSIAAEQDTIADYSREDHIGDGNSINVINDESTIASVVPTDVQSGGNAPTKKLGFGLVGSGKRTTVPSVFHEEEDDDAHKDKKMRPLVPIDYSTEELQAVQPTVSGPTPPNLAAAAEFAKRISSTNFKEEKLDGERDRSRRSNEKSNHRDRSDEDGTHNRDENKERIPSRDRDRDHGSEKLKTSDNKRLLDAKQLIDMIPKTKEELFSYEIDWTVYDKHQLHERMRPWISKKIKEFLGEEETTLIDYIVSSTQEHVKASQMLERLQIILDEEAEMFVLKMWRMLIFEIKKVESGLALRSKS